MFTIDFPDYEFKLKEAAGKRTIFDIVRKKYVVATPEEIIRQHIIHYLIEEKNYPKPLLSIEMSLTLNRTRRRCDIVAYKGNAPALIVECKAPSVKLNQKVFEQIARYNMVLQVPYLLVSNGNFCYCCKVDFTTGGYYFLDNMPGYNEL